jgi:hypothetical protein
MMEAYQNIGEQLELEHLLLVDRKCRTCGQTKNLLADFYMTHRDRGPFPSAYAYECKVCTVKRVIRSRNKDTIVPELYPDW